MKNRVRRLSRPSLLMSELELICPDWEAPASVHAASTTRRGGESQGPYHALNLGESTGDDFAIVRANRRRLVQALDLPSEPCWLRQEHTARVVEVDAYRKEAADASYTSRPGDVCVVKTADCLPVLLCSTMRPWVAAVHVGWRGLAQDIVSRAIAAYAGSSSELLAWLGPAIGATHYEVDEAVVQHLEVSLAEVCLQASHRPGHWLLSLADAARHQLENAGVTRICQNTTSDTGTPLCTFEDSRFYSFRRDGITGRMATLVWLSP